MIVCAHCLWATPYLTLPEASTESTLDSDSDSDSDRDKRSEKTPVQTKAESSSSSSGMLHFSNLQLCFLNIFPDSSEDEHESGSESGRLALSPYNSMSSLK